MSVSLSQQPESSLFSFYTGKISEPCFQNKPRMEENSDYSSAACIHKVPVTRFL